MSAPVIRVLHNFPEITLKLGMLEDAVGNKVMARALNTTVQQAKPRMASQISKEFRISVSDAKERLDVSKAFKKDGEFRMEASLSARNKAKGRSMNLIAFVERAITLAERNRRVKAGEGGKHKLRGGGEITKALQLRFQIKRSGGKQMIKGAFIANNGRTVFIRKGKERTPIRSLSTIDIPNMFNTKRINEVVVKVMLERFQFNFERELRAVTQGWVK